MTQVHDTCLIILLPKSVEETLIDHLLEHPEWVSGFTTTEVNGHGRSVPCHGPAEEVRGRSARVQVQIVMNAADAQALLAHLKDSMRNREIAYWLTPVTEFGRFA